MPLRGSRHKDTVQHQPILQRTMMARVRIRAIADTRYSFTAQFLRGGAIFARRAHEIERTRSKRKQTSLTNCNPNMSHASWARSRKRQRPWHFTHTYYSRPSHVLPPIPGHSRVSNRVSDWGKPGIDMLADIQVKKAKPGAKPYKMVDGSGLHLFVTPAGGKHWRYRYEFDGKEKLLRIASVSITDVRTTRDEAKVTLRAGRDPNRAKRLERAVTTTTDSETFEVLAREWHGLNKAEWTKIHAADVINSLERDVFPELGAFPIREITAPMVLSALEAAWGMPSTRQRSVFRRMRCGFGAIARNNPATKWPGEACFIRVLEPVRFRIDEGCHLEETESDRARNE
jgi:hypothetical protein